MQPILTETFRILSKTVEIYFDAFADLVPPQGLELGLLIW